MRSADYVEETTTSIASSGAGAVTLTAITNTPRFSTVFGTQNTTVRYVIEDTVNKKIEQGVGAISSNVLTRTRPQITWDGSTWNDQAPSALTFTGSPSSGDIKIRMSPVAESAFLSMPMKQNSIGGDSWLAYPWSHHQVTNSNGSGYTMVQNREYYHQYKLPYAGLLQGAQFEVTNPDSGKNLKWALYSIGYDGLPDKKIVDFVTTSLTSNGIKTDTAVASWSPAGKVWLTPGWYYIGTITDSAATAQLRSFGSGNNYSSESPLGRQNGYGNAPWVYVAGNYTTGLPATANVAGGGLGDAGSKDFLFIGLKVVG